VGEWPKGPVEAIPAPSRSLKGHRRDFRHLSVIPRVKRLRSHNELSMCFCLGKWVIADASGYKTDLAKSLIIDLAYLVHPADVAVLGAGMKFLSTMVHSKALAGKLGKRIYPPLEFDMQKAVRD
jgi:hypothetical protein